MAQRVGATRRPLGGLLAGLGRATAPVLRAMSRASILRLDGEQPLAGLRAPAGVQLDAHGIPHIRAASDADAFRVQGFLHARDRFFQMDMLRRVLSGRLCAVVGERPLGSLRGALSVPPLDGDVSTLHADRLMRALGLERAAERVWDEGTAEGRALLTAYVEGVNDAVERMRRKRPLEHRLLGLALEPWRPTDSVLIGKGMALGLAFKWRAAPVFSAIADALKDAPEHLAGILPPVPGEGALSIARCITEGLGAALRFVPPAPPAGSNAWLVAGGRTRSGMPIVASDPHLDLSLPAIWYLASLHAARYKAVGCSLPGLPGVVIGRTPDVAWALTNGMLDDCDIWVEELDESGTRYRCDGVWRDLEIEPYEITRKRGEPASGHVRRTHRGPLLTDAFPGYAGPALSIRMALHEPTRDMDAFLGLGRSRTVEEGLAAARLYGSPVQNLLIADTQGRASYRLIGQVPRRPLERHPALPRDGTTSAEDWTGWARDLELPHLDLDPDDQVVSANHPPAEGSYPVYLSHLFEPDYRAERITGLLLGRDDLTAGDMQRIQSDAVNAAVDRFRLTILEPQVESVRRLRPTLGPLLEVLLRWDGDERAEGIGGVPWHLAYHHLVVRTFGPTLGDDLLGHWQGVINLVDAALYRAFTDDRSPWAPPGERARLVCEALEATSRDLQARGLQLDSPWGAFHTLELKHPAGAAPPLARAFNRGPFPADGGPFSVVSGQYLHARPGPVIAGQSYRHVIDLAEPAAARMITFGGQSGHIGSPHYDDLTPLWRRFETVPMRLEEPLEGVPVIPFTPR